MSLTYPHDTAAEVRAELARQRKTQAGLAAAIGLSAASVSRRLDGTYPIADHELAEIARFLQVPIARLTLQAA